MLEIHDEIKKFRLSSKINKKEEWKIKKEKKERREGEMKKVKKVKGKI